LFRGSFAFPTLSIKDKNYKLFGLVTNMEMEGEALINWHYLLGQTLKICSTLDFEKCRFFAKKQLEISH